MRQRGSLRVEVGGEEGGGFVDTKMLENSILEIITQTATIQPPFPILS